MSIKEKVIKLIGEEKAKALEVLFSTTPTEAPVAPVKCVDVKTKDGAILRIEGDAPKVGAKVTSVSETGESPAADGQYVLEDGTSLTVLAGLVSEVESAQAETTEDSVDPQQMANEDFAKCVTKMTHKYGDVATAQKVCSAIKNGPVTQSAIVEMNEKMVDAEIAFNKSIKELQDKKTVDFTKEIELLKEQNKAMFAVIEKIADLPADEPTVKPAEPTKESFLATFRREAKELKANRKNR